MYMLQNLGSSIENFLPASVMMLGLLTRLVRQMKVMHMGVVILQDV